jgi:putative membrane protein
MTRRRALRLALACAALVGAACARDGTEVVDCADFVMSPSQYTGQARGRFGATDNAELNFVCRAAAYGRAQMIYAEMAQRQAAAPQVRRFAAETLAAQRLLSRRLDQVAIEQEGITPPPGLEPAQIALRDRLAQLSGASFDQAYLQHVVEDGRAALALFHEGSVLPEPFISQFAGHSVPALEQRVSEAQSLLHEPGA